VTLTTEAPAPVEAKIVLDAAALRKALGRVRHAVAGDEARPVLTTVAFQADGESLRLVAADNYRLATMTIDVASGSVESATPFLLQKGDIGHLRAFLKDYDTSPLLVARDAQTVTFAHGRRSVTYVTLDGVFPDYRSLVETATTPDPLAVVGVTPALLDGLQAGSDGAPLWMFVGATETPIVFASGVDSYREYLMSVRMGGDTPNRGL